MDIANRFGVKAHARGPKGTRFVVTIAGLTENPTYGACAVRGVALTAVPDFTEEAPTEISYQWHSVSGGAIAGATSDSFTPGAGMDDLSVIYCVVTVPTGSRSSTQVTLRETPPLVQGSLADVVHDQGTGPQTMATAGVFAGNNLSFAVSGAGAGIDAQSGEVIIPTETAMAEAVVTVTASNSGGAVSAAFQVTVTEQAEDPVVVTLTGLTDNPTYGLCATRGVALAADVGGYGGDMSDLAYQWHSTPGGIIDGATSASFTPGSALADLSEIYCVVTAFAGSWQSASVLLREVAPQSQGSLVDEVFDLGTGVQVVATAAAFVGENLRFEVSGAGASINELTGDVSVPTDTELSGAVVTVTAFNSGGTVALGFQVTVEDLVTLEGALPFGALTPAGAGGVPVAGNAITTGDPGGHWEISGGMLVPSAAGAGALAGVYPLAFDNGDTLDVMIEDDKASVRVDEITAVFAALPLSARGLLVQDGDGRSLGRLRLVPKAFENEMVMEPANWLEDDDQRQSVRPVTLGGLTIGGDATNAAQLRMENLTIQGFEFQMEQGSGESEGNNGIVLVERPSRHVTIRQNEIWSRTTEDILAAGDYAENLSSSRQMRGIGTSVYEGTNEHIIIDDNWLHDCSRGATLTSMNSYLGVRSRFCGNIIEHVYTNFFSAGFLDGLDIFDNYCMGVYAADENTDGFVGSSGDGPHSATGGSFDTGGARSTANVSLIGNFLHVGWKRTKLHADLGLPVPKIQATGIKFNDPRAIDSYWNIVAAFNTVISHGLCLEISGASSDSHVLVFNNTLADEDYNNAGSVPVISPGGSSNIRMWNNVACGYYINGEDDQGIYPASLDTLEGYGNLQITSAPTSALGHSNYFVGDPVKGLTELTIEEALVAYVPKQSTRAMTAAQKKGALGTGLYAGNGVHSVSYDKPAPVGGVAHDYPLTRWVGGAHLYKGSEMANLPPQTDGLTFAFKGQSAASVDGATRYLFTMAQQRLSIRKGSSGAIYMRLEANDGRVITEGYSHGQTFNSADEVADYVVSIDLAGGAVLFMQNGVLANWYTLNPVGAEPLDLRQHTNRVLGGIGTQAQDLWEGDMGLFYMHDTFVDLETVAGQSAFYAEDGRFRDFGADGSAPTGTQPLIFVAGDAATITATPNRGRGGSFAVSGNTISDAGAAPVFAFNEGSSTGTFYTAGGHRIWEGGDGDTLTFDGAGSIAVLEMRGAGGGGGHRVGGGGGAGELVQLTDVPVTAQTYTASVGAGGPGALATSTPAGSGGDTRFIGGTNHDITFTARGGGGGGSYSSSAKNGVQGGSGGGGAGVSNANGAAATAADGFGFAGGGSDSGSGGGGGGAAGAAAGNAGTTASGAGGAGRATLVPGTSGLVCRGGDGGATTGTNGPDGTAYGDGGKGGSGTYLARNGGAGAAGRIYVALPV